MFIYIIKYITLELQKNLFIVAVLKSNEIRNFERDIYKSDLFLECKRISSNPGGVTAATQ